MNRNIGINLNATDTTKRAFDSATRNAKRYQSQLDQTSKSTRAMTRQSRAHFGQLGHQLQDVAVQYQMGVNPLMILGQQGSQVASIFGAKGAMIGGFIAVAAVLGQQLIPELFKSAKSMSDLKDELDGLSKSLKTTEGGIELVGDAIKEAFESSAAEGMLEAKRQLIELDNAIKDTGATLEEAFSDKLDKSFMNIWDGASKLGSAIDHIRDGNLEDGLNVARVAGRGLAREFKTASEVGVAFAQAAAQAAANPTVEGLEALALAAIDFSNAANNADVTIMAADIAELARAAGVAEEQVQSLKSVIEESGGTKRTYDDATPNVFASKEDIMGGRAGAEAQRNFKTVLDLMRQSKEAEEERIERNKRGEALLAKIRGQRFAETQRLLQERVKADKKAELELAKAEEKRVREAMQRAQDLRDHVKKIEEEQTAAMQAIADRGLGALEDGLVGVISGTKSASNAFKDMARSIVNDLLRMQIQQSITGPLSGLLNSALGSLFGSPSVSAVSNASQISAEQAMGRRATGGPVSRGKPYLVGERGPELMVPNGSGSVVPNNALSDQGVTVVQNINVTTGIQQTVRAEIANLMPQIVEASKAGVLEARQRGGSFSRGLAGI